MLRQTIPASDSAYKIIKSSGCRFCSVNQTSKSAYYLQMHPKFRALFITFRDLCLNEKYALEEYFLTKYSLSFFRAHVSEKRTIDFV